MKKHIITVTGYPGSGKSSTAKGTAEKLGYGHFSSGDLFRKMAVERGISIEEINITAEKQKEIDFEVDTLLRKIGREENDIVIDSRTAFHWIPDSFKVFLKLNPRTAAERAFKHMQEEGRVSQEGSSVDEVYKNTLERVGSERKRFWGLYNLDITDEKQFDLVVDTGLNNLEEVIGIVVAAYQKWLKS